MGVPVGLHSIRAAWESSRDDPGAVPQEENSTGVRFLQVVRLRGNCSELRRWTWRGTFTNDEKEAAPGWRVANAPTPGWPRVGWVDR